ncbi:MAG: AAA family ATPase [Hyphomicrobiales bacterium]|nr:AAA family ATPase [Hyphomicrobiales bacterium]MDE2115740.1 AAA family ATPase [Hyphomicrobiales bacterium]
MRLVNLTVRNFRGFGNTAETISLDGDVLLFYGPNGFGKTSLAEAIEWLFYGITKRRQQGESYSRSEYANSFANVHGGSPTEVSATVDWGGRHIVLSRRLTQAEASETFVDGTRISFSSINLNPIEAVYPVIAQHGLQTFVHSKPKDRRDAICAALGLDELTTLKNALDSARSSFQRTPPRSVSDARQELVANARTLSQITETQELARRWLSTTLQLRIDIDRQALLGAARTLTGAACTNSDDALASLRERRQLASRSVFDADKIKPNHSTLPAIKTEFEAVKVRLTDVERAIAAVVASMASAYKSAFLELWKKGLELSPSGDECPMCEENTLNSTKRTELEKRLADSADRIAKNEALTTAVIAAKARIASLTSHIGEFGVGELTTDDVEQLRKLFAIDLQPLDSFLPELEAFRTARIDVLQKLKVAEAFLNSCAAQLEAPDAMPLVVEQAARIKDALTSVAEPSVQALHAYSEHWCTFEPRFSALISSDEFVARIDAVGKTLRAEPMMRVLDRYDKVLEETQELIRSVEAEMQRRQASLLSTRGAEVKGLYDRLNRGADVVFESMEPGTDSMKLNAKSFGTRMSAAANLSECQLNCLGLAMWLMRATTPSSPFGFVLLDDPVQSMDDDHTEAFISDIVPHLLDDHGKQVIVLSHVKRITERLRELNPARRLKVFHYDSYARGGPAITEQIALQKLLTEIRGAARGNEENRAYSVDRIRILSERLIRELHLQVMGVPAPSPQYDRATAKELLPLFQSITGTTPQEHVSLRDTISFSDPAHHTEVGYSVPVLSNIQPHIDRLETILRKYRLIS